MVHKALTICAQILIPSIFPFMVITNLLISCNFDEIVKSIIKKPFEALFHLNANLASAYFLGIVAGYPQGAYAVSAVYDKGGCTKEEAEQALCFCNNTGPSFIIAGVGAMYGNIRVGITIYLLQIGVSILYGIITRPKKPSLCEYDHIKRDIDLGVIPRAVTSSVIPMLNICAYVIVFSILCSMLAAAPINDCLKGLLLSVTEISYACNYISQNHLPLPLTGFAVLWSGICVHMQTYTVINGKLSLKKHYTAKLIQGLCVFFILYLKNIVF